MTLADTAARPKQDVLMRALRYVSDAQDWLGRYAVEKRIPLFISIRSYDDGETPAIYMAANPSGSPKLRTEALFLTSDGSRFETNVVAYGLDSAMELIDDAAAKYAERYK